jgi:hypothetical protein
MPGLELDEFAMVVGSVTLIELKVDEVTLWTSLIL